MIQFSPATNIIFITPPNPTRPPFPLCAPISSLSSSSSASPSSSSIHSHHHNHHHDDPGHHQPGHLLQHGRLLLLHLERLVPVVQDPLPSHLPSQVHSLQMNTLLEVQSLQKNTNFANVSLHVNIKGNGEDLLKRIVTFQTYHLHCFCHACCYSQALPTILQFSLDFTRLFGRF